MSDLRFKSRSRSRFGLGSRLLAWLAARAARLVVRLPTGLLIAALRLTLWVTALSGASREPLQELIHLLRTDPGTWAGGTKAFHGAWSGFVNYSSAGDPTSGGGNWHMMRGRVSTADANWWGFSCTNGPLTLCVEWSGYPR